MEISDLLSISGVGIALSLIIRHLKDVFQIEGNATKLLTFGLALIVATVFVLFNETSWWQTFVGILAAASTVYAFILKKE